MAMSRPGDYCRQHTACIIGCSGAGRPTCQAGECLYGAEPCPNPACRGFKGEGLTCNWCGYNDDDDKDQAD